MRALGKAVLCWWIGLSCALAGTQPSALHGGESRVGFQLRLWWFGQVSGSFHDLRGALRRQQGKLRICAWVPVDSARMASAAHRRELLGPDFFAAATHPQIRFVSAPLAPALLASGGALSGRLTLRGQTREVRFQLAPMHCSAADPADCRVRLQGQVQRSDFGMRAKPGVLGDTVRLQLDLRTCASGRAGCEAAPACFGPD